MRFLSALIFLFLISCTTIESGGSRLPAQQSLLSSIEHAGETAYQYEYEKKGKIVAIGDVHADPVALLNALINQKVLDKDGNFIAESIDLVLLGDFADKGPDTRAVWDIISYISLRARANNSRVHSLFGNHDSVILMGNLTRMKEEDLNKFKVFDEDPVVGVKRALLEEPYRSMMQSWKSMVKIGDFIFVHGGIDDFILEYSPSQINYEVHEYVKAQQNYIELSLQGHTEDPPEIPWHLKPWTFDSPNPMPDNPLWTREAAKERMSKEKMKELLDHLGAKRMVVGHTPTQSSEIEEALGGLVIKADTKASSGFSGGHVSAVVITKNNKIKYKNKIKRKKGSRLLKIIRGDHSINCSELIEEFVL